MEKLAEGDSSEGVFLNLLIQTLERRSIRITDSNHQRVDAHFISSPASTSTPRYVRPAENSSDDTSITLFPSAQSWQERIARGNPVSNPVICPDTADPLVYNQQGRLPLSSGEKVRIVLAQLRGDSPSRLYVDLPWLEQNLDWSRFTCTAVGMPSPSLEHVHTAAWEGVESFASVLKQHHVLIQMHSHDEGAHPLLAALSSGLPVLYHQGDHSARTCVGFAGLPFHNMDDLPSQLDRLCEYHQHFTHVIATREVAEVSNAYAAFFRLVRGE
jgi:hypothetical protein